MRQHALFFSADGGRGRGSSAGYRKKTVGCLGRGVEVECSGSSRKTRLFLQDIKGSHGIRWGIIVLLNKKI